MNWFTKLLRGRRSVIKVPKIIANKFHEFPCTSDNCLVRMSCTQACDKIIMDDNKLKEAFMKYNACPDCGGEEFREGPYGGMSRNVRCANCGHQFNWALPISIERIHITSNGIFR